MARAVHVTVADPDDRCGGLAQHGPDQVADVETSTATSPWSVCMRVPARKTFCRPRGDQRAAAAVRAELELTACVTSQQLLHMVDSLPTDTVSSPVEVTLAELPLT